MKPAEREALEGLYGECLARLGDQHWTSLGLQRVINMQGYHEAANAPGGASSAEREEWLARTRQSQEFIGRAIGCVTGVVPLVTV